MRTRRTDAEVMDLLRGRSPLNRARGKFSGYAARIEQEAMQRRPAGPVEIRRIEFEAVDAIAAELAVPEMLEALKLVMQHGRIDDSEERMNIVAAAIVRAEGRS